MIACFIYNSFNIVAWCAVACHFGHWWIALFARVTMIVYIDHKSDI